MSANERQIGGDHYACAIQHWDMIEDHGIGYLEGCATKYITRWRKKNGLEDLEKAYHYTEKLLEKHETIVRMPRGEVPAEVVAEYTHANRLESIEEEVVYLLTSRWTSLNLKHVMRLIQHLIENTKAIGTCACEED